MCAVLLHINLSCNILHFVVIKGTKLNRYKIMKFLTVYFKRHAILENHSQKYFLKKYFELIKYLKIPHIATYNLSTTNYKMNETLTLVWNCQSKYLAYLDNLLNKNRAKIYSSFKLLKNPVKNLNNAETIIIEKCFRYSESYNRQYYFYE